MKNRLLIVLFLLTTSCAFLLANTHTMLIMNKKDSLMLAEKGLIGQPQGYDSSAVLKNLLNDLSYSVADSAFIYPIKFYDLKAFIIRAEFDGVSSCNTMTPFQIDSSVRSFFTPSKIK